MCLFLYFSYFQLNLGNKSGRGSGVSMALQNLVNSAISGTDANKDTSAKTSRSPSLSGFSLKSFCLHYDIWIYLIKTSNRWIHSEFCFVNSLWTSEFFFSQEIYLDDAIYTFLFPWSLKIWIKLILLPVYFIGTLLYRIINFVTPSRPASKHSRNCIAQTTWYLWTSNWV